MKKYAFSRFAAPALVTEDMDVDQLLSAVKEGKVKGYISDDEGLELISKLASESGGFALDADKFTEGEIHVGTAVVENKKVLQVRPNSRNQSGMSIFVRFELEEGTEHNVAANRMTAKQIKDAKAQKEIKLKVMKVKLGDNEILLFNIAD